MPNAPAQHPEMLRVPDFWMPNRRKPSNEITRQTFVRNKYRAFFISCTVYTLHVSAYITSHPQVMLYNTKYLKRSYHIIATDPLSRY
jgi:hypothetical protein